MLLTHGMFRKLWREEEFARRKCAASKKSRLCSARSPDAHKKVQLSASYANVNCHLPAATRRFRRQPFMPRTAQLLRSLPSILSMRSFLSSCESCQYHDAYDQGFTCAHLRAYRVLGSLSSYLIVCNGCCWVVV